MAKGRHQKPAIPSNPGRNQRRQNGSPITPIKSLYDHLAPTGEYASIVGVAPEAFDARNELRRAIADIEAIRGRPLLLYAANVIQAFQDASVGIDLTDDLPFAEMAAAVGPSIQAVDIFLVTPGGLGQQVAQFVDRLRPRFSDVDFIVPQRAMSAGTIWVLSGNEIWMDERATLGPIDPQVPSKDGRLVPAQAIQSLLREIQERGQNLLDGGRQPPWTDLQLLRNIDAKELGNSIALSKYSIQLAATYLAQHKFRDWKVRGSNGAPVTDEHKKQRAQEIAEKLCSHDQWKVHSHGISREVAWEQIRLKISHPESVPGLQGSIRRLWSLLYWTFEHTSVFKLFLSQNYSLFRSVNR